MLPIVKNIDTHIKNLEYKINLNSLLEIIIREHTELHQSLKITKKFVQFLESIVKFQKFGEIRLSKILDKNHKHYFISNEMPSYKTIYEEKNIYILNEMYLKMLNILINYNIMFDFGNIYIENRVKMINDVNNNVVVKQLQDACQHMDFLINKHIGSINEIPEGTTINSDCTIGSIVHFYLEKNL